ncbi:MAG TPA: hypothetical protein VGR90_01715 [Acidimicrobiales bacterium]|nr:hypothetical protein [Acidimicrobiales bacterium]
MPARPPRLVSATFAETDDVLFGLPHPTGAVVVFGQDTWDFRAVEGLAPNVAPSSLVVAWESFASPGFALAAKEVLFAQLHPDHPVVLQRLASRRRALSLRGVGNHIGSWRAWFAWLGEADVDALGEVGPHHWEAYLVRRRADGVSPEHLAVTIGRIRDFYDYAPVLSESTYATRPWGRRTAMAVAGHKPRRLENATRPIPEDAFGPLVAGALHLVAHAEVIIAARDVQMGLFAGRVGADQAMPFGRRGLEADQRLDALIEAHRAKRRPLPMHSKKGRHATNPALRGVNLRMLGLWAGLGRAAFEAPARRAKVAAAVEELGVAPAALTRRFDEAHRHEEAFGQLIWPGVIADAVQALVTACFVVIALSGMRAEEITAIRRGCVERVQLRNGDWRLRLHGIVYKRRRHGGVPASWVVIDEIATAVAVLERLAPSGSDLLFVPQTLRSYGALTPLGVATFSMNHYLAGFCEWLAGPVLPPGLVPLPAGTRVTTRQFRRTMARALAFRPHGVVAGKVQLKHLKVATSEGYYGRANSSLAAFHEEIETEAAAARLGAAKDRYLAYIDGSGVAGGARRALARHFSAIAAEMATFTGTTLETDRHLEELLADRLGRLHVGVVNDCWFIDPERAACRNGDEAPSVPRPNACVGDRCANAVVTAVHLPVYRAAHDQVVSLRRSRKVSAFEKERLAAEQSRLDAVIEAVEGRP